MSSDSEDSSVSLKVRLQGRKTRRKTGNEDSFKIKRSKKSMRSVSEISSKNLNLKPDKGREKVSLQSKSRMHRKPYRLSSDSKIKSKTSQGSRNLRKLDRSVSYKKSSPAAVDTSVSESSSGILSLKHESKSCKISDSEASDDNLKLKKKEISNKTDDYDHHCFQCSVKFSSNTEEYNHICKEKQEKGYICECKKLLSSFRGMETHKRFGCKRKIPKVYKPVKYYQRNCIKCSVTFSKSSEEYEHTCEGKPEKGFLCECKQLLSSFRGMETHKRFGCNRKIPKVLKPVKHYQRSCVKCSVKFSDSNEEYKHTCEGKPEKGFLCECKQLLSSFRGMETHKRFGCNRKIPKLKNIDKDYDRRLNVIHLKHTDKYFDRCCVQCSVKFSDRYEEYNHTCKEKLEKGFLCESNTLLSSFQGMETHKRFSCNRKAKTIEKDYDRCCFQCSVRFSDSNEDYNHTCKGKLEKGFRCECKMLFYSFQGMVTHKRFGCNRDP